MASKQAPNKSKPKPEPEPEPIRFPPPLPEDAEPMAHLYHALASARAVCSVGVDKAGWNDQYKYKYASAEAIFSLAGGALSRFGLSVFPMKQVFDRERHEIQSVYRVAHMSGASLDIPNGPTPISTDKKPLDKRVGAAKTFDLRYFLRGLCGIPQVDQDEEVNQRDDSSYEYRPQQNQQNGGQQGQKSEPQRNNGAAQRERIEKKKAEERAHLERKRKAWDAAVRVLHEDGAAAVVAEAKENGVDPIELLENAVAEKEAGPHTPAEFNENGDEIDPATGEVIPPLEGPPAEEEPPPPDDPPPEEDDRPGVQPNGKTIAEEQAAYEKAGGNPQRGYRSS